MDLYPLYTEGSQFCNVMEIIPILMDIEETPAAVLILT